MQRLKTRPSIIALTGLHLFTSYVFPSGTRFAESAEIETSDETLRFNYFSVGYSVLKTSMGEAEDLLIKDQGYTEADIRFRRIYQGQLAVVLAALAPQYGPQFVNELSALATRLSVGMPPNLVQMSQFLASRLKQGPYDGDDPGMAISAAIARGEYEKASDLIGKIEDEGQKKSYTQLLVKARFRSHVAASEFPEALRDARRFEAPDGRLILYAELIRAAHKKGDANFARFALGEARTIPGEEGKMGIRARALLSFSSEALSVSEPDALEFLRNAVSAINSLPTRGAGDESAIRSIQEIALAEINDPRNLIDAPEVQKAFVTAGGANFDVAVMIAGRIEFKPVQMMAKLAAVEETIRKGAKKLGTVSPKEPAGNGSKKQTL